MHSVSADMAKSAIEKGLWPGYVHAYPPKQAYRPLTGVKMADIWASPPARLNLYFHTPFCMRKCGFCNLFSVSVSEQELQSTVAAYCQAMERQCLFHRELVASSQISSVYFGGGTPNLIPLASLDSLFDTIHSAFPTFADDVETCMECSPEFLCREYLLGLRSLGFKRLSLGFQSLNKHELERINRCADVDRIRASFDLARALGFSINIDIIYGLPRQNTGSFADTLKQVIELCPENVTAYPLAIRRLTDIYENQADACMSMPEKYALYDYAKDTLEEAGYSQETVVRFARPTTLTYQQQRLEFMGFQTLGIGAGARSYARDVHYCMPYTLGRARAQKVIDTYTACQDFDSIEYEGFCLDDDEQCRRAVIFALLGDGLCLESFRSRFGFSFENVFGDELNSLLSNGLVVSSADNGVLRLTKRGRKYSDIAASLFFSDTVRGRMDSFVAT